MDANKVIAAIADRYDGRCLELLTQIQAALAEEVAFEQGPFAETLDDFRWSLVGLRAYDGMKIHLTIILAESAQYDGEDEFGINWRLEVVEESGRELIGWSPFNYTPNVWVDARDELRVEERFAYFAAIDMVTLTDAVAREASV